MKRSFYKEEQYFSNPGLWVFVALVFTFVIAPTALGLYKQMALNEPIGDKMMTNEGLIVLLILLLIMSFATFLLFKKMKLVVEVDSDGLHYRYPPFILKNRCFTKEEIDHYEIRKYKPIQEYSGWGIRYNWSKSGRAFNVKGNIGLQLYLRDGKKVLFGTQRGDALRRAMQKMMKEV